jgi:hypothetical protein
MNKMCKQTKNNWIDRQGPYWVKGKLEAWLYNWDKSGNIDSKMEKIKDWKHWNQKGEQTMGNDFLK